MTTVRHHDFPFWECAKAAHKVVETAPGCHVHQKFTCSHCGARQTMSVPDTFYKSGQCEVCAEITDIEANGCNFIVVMSLAAAP